MVVEGLLPVMSERGRHSFPHLRVQADVSLRPRFPLSLWYVAQFAVGRGRVGAFGGQRSSRGSQCLRGGAEQHLCHVWLGGACCRASLASTRVVDGFLQSLRVCTQSRTRSKISHAHRSRCQKLSASKLSKPAATRRALDARGRTTLLVVGLDSQVCTAASASRLARRRPTSLCCSLASQVHQQT